MMTPNDTIITYDFPEEEGGDFWGSARVWEDKVNIQIGGYDLDYSVARDITPGQARAIAKALNAFADAAEQGLPGVPLDTFDP